MRREKKQSGASLDSLLDTMTNVVGILVIVLTVTQLGVQDAVKRISATTTVDPEELRRAEEELLRQIKIAEVLQEQLKEVEPKEVDREKAKLDLGRLLKMLYDARHDIEVLKQRKEDLAKEAAAAIEKLLDEARKKLEEFQKKEKELADKIVVVDDKMAELRAMLADTPEQSAPPAKIIYLPNPRDAPEGAQPLYFLCWEGKIAFVDVDGLRDKAQRRAEYLARPLAARANPAAGIDGKALADAFNENKIRDRDFELEMTISGRYPQLIFHARSDAGENTEQIQNASSRYQQKLRRIDPKQYYLQFYVWPDSFETYLEARKVASERDLLAGWTARGGTPEYRTSLGGKLRVGPEPKPTKPTPTDPNQPKPKPVPKDTID